MSCVGMRLISFNWFRELIIFITFEDLFSSGFDELKILWLFKIISLERFNFWGLGISIFSVIKNCWIFSSWELYLIGIFVEFKAFSGIVILLFFDWSIFSWGIGRMLVKIFCGFVLSFFNFSRLKLLEIVWLLSFSLKLSCWMVILFLSFPSILVFIKYVLMASSLGFTNFSNFEKLKKF